MTQRAAYVKEENKGENKRKKGVTKGGEGGEA